VLRDTSSESDTTTLDIFDREVSRPSLSSPVASTSSSWHRASIPATKPSAASNLALFPCSGHLTIDLRLVTQVNVYLESKRFTNAFIIKRYGYYFFHYFFLKELIYHVNVPSLVIFIPMKKVLLLCWYSRIRYH